MPSLQKDALSTLYRSLTFIDPVREPRVALCAWHNLTYYLAAAGRLMEAQRVLARARPLYKQFLEPRCQSRRMTLEAKIASGLGYHRQAEALLAKAREGFLSAGAIWESDQVSRDLASLGARSAPSS